MLQQTQVGTVIPYYRRFLRRFPTLRALAAADVDEVLRHFAGLGYYARARNLHAAAMQIAANHGGKFPARFEDIAALPGVGRSTAGAIASFALKQRRAILDANVKRVLSRYCAVDGAPAAASTQAQLWRIAEAQLPPSRVADYNQALMDLGATVCARKPKCAACPLIADCRAHRAGDPAAYPAPRAVAKARPRRAVFMLVIRDRRRHVLLVQRPPHGIWGGLWSLPELPRPAAKNPAKSTPAAAKSKPPKPRRPTAAQRRRLEAWCAREFGLRVTVGGALPAFTHSFTHFDLDIRPLLADCGAGVDAAGRVWHNPADPAPVAVGVPAAVARILESVK